MLPQIRSSLFACLEQRDLAGKVWLRTSSDRPSAILRRGVEVAKAFAIAWLAAALRGKQPRVAFPPMKGSRGFRRSIRRAITPPISPVISALQDTAILSCAIPDIAMKNSPPWTR